MYSTYVLYSPQFDKIYVGYSANLKSRLATHNSDENDGWTANFQPWQLLYSEDFEFKADAMKREKQLKTSRGRIFIWELVKGMNP